MTYSDPMRGLPGNLKSYVCICVFEGRKPVLYVTRADGDWCALCGDDHPQEAAYYRVVGLGHVVGDDPTISDVLDLQPDEEAERETVGSAWVRGVVSP